jgi:hypothetical protein
VQDQGQKNDTLFIRNLPREVVDNVMLRNDVIEKIFDTLNINLKSTVYASSAFPQYSLNQQAATVELTLPSSLLKITAMKNFRSIRGDKQNYNGQFLCEKFAELPVGSLLNGKSIMLANKLSQHNLDLAKHARSFVDTHFEFVFETPDSRLLVFRDGFHPINTTEDVQRLVEKFDNNRLNKKKSKSQHQSTSSANDGRATRSQRKGKQS